MIIFKIIFNTLKFFKQIFNSAHLFPYFACISIDDIDYSQKLYKFIRFLNRKEFNVRYKYKSLADKNITKNLLKNGFSKSSEKTKILAKNLNLKERFHEINWQSKKVNKRKKWMWYFEPEIDEKIVEFTIHLAKELSGYLEGLPVVRSIYFWNSFPKDKVNIYRGSQLFHMDNNDWRQIRFFYAIESIDSFNGSPEYIPSRISYEIYKKFSSKEKYNSRNKKRPDYFFNEYKNQIIQTEALQDESFFLDTGNCYHRGSRDMKKARKVFVIQFMTPFHIHTKIINRNKNLNMPKFIKNDLEARYVFQYYKNSLPQKGY